MKFFKKVKAMKYFNINADEILDAYYKAQCVSKIDDKELWNMDATDFICCLEAVLAEGQK
jgi:hypothetical protein